MGYTLTRRGVRMHRNKYGGSAGPRLSKLKRTCAGNLPLMGSIDGGNALGKQT